MSRVERLKEPGEASTGRVVAELGRIARSLASDLDLDRS